MASSGGVDKQLDAATMTTPDDDTIVTESRGAQTRHNMFTPILRWLCLAGSIMYPEPFGFLSRLGVINRLATGGTVNFAIRNVPYLYVAAFSVLLGGLAIVWLWWTIKYNYVWLAGRILW
ncbi:hypothetical protein F5X96DRAFT_683941 [Biscogniauxia mediterranea]|nr:hypothetical protein F5X96DRAFT_683941 [Biscogniauxia mediterranea]